MMITPGGTVSMVDSVEENGQCGLSYISPEGSNADLSSGE